MLPNKKTKLNLIIVLAAMALAVLSLPAAATAQDVNDFNVPDFNLPEEPILPEEPNLLAEPQMPGTIEGTGTYFEVTDSNYINITFESTEPVHLRLESVPQMVVMEIEAANDVNSTDITLCGFLPSTTYYKYEDDYHNEVAFTADPNGSYAYTQDITERHLVFIQPSPSTIFLSDSGWSKPVGNWDPCTLTATLTQDVSETIQIDSDGITLDGNGFSAIGSGTGYGVYLNGRTGVTITNLTVEGFSRGIYLYYNCHNNTLTGNTANSNGSIGIYLYNSSNNILTGNTANSNTYGIYLAYSNNNILTGNTASDNSGAGIQLGFSGGCVMTGNIMAGNKVNFDVRTFSNFSGSFFHDIDTTNTAEGKAIYYLVNESGKIYDNSTAPDAGVFYAINCDNITIRDLTVNGSCQGGIFLWGTHNSTIENITASNNQFGIYLQYSFNNTIKDCYSTNNERGILLMQSNANTLTNNTASSNFYYGVTINYSGGNIMTGNTMSANRYNFHVAGFGLGDFNNDIDTTNTVEGKPIYYVYGDSGTIYDSSTAPDAGLFYAIDCNNITIKDLTPANNNYYGVYLWGTHNSTIENVSASNSYDGICIYNSTNNTLTGNTISGSSRSGIHLQYSASNTITDCTSTNNGYGIYLYNSTDNTLSGNTTSGSSNRGIYLQYSSNNTVTNCNSTNDNCGIYLSESSNANILTGNITNSNSLGIGISYSSTSNTLTNNTANMNSYYGIYLDRSSSNTLTGNTMSANRYNFLINGYQSSDFDNNIDATNMVEGQPIYYVYGESDTIYDSSTAPNAGVFYAIDCNNITIRDLTPANNNCEGIYLWGTHNSTIENVSASNGYHGIYLYQSTTNTLTCNTVSGNSLSGIFISNSTNNILTGNKASNNNVGIYLYSSSNNNTLTYNTVALNSSNGMRVYGSSNNIYNNNFIGNPTQAYVYGTDNVFNLAAPTGGNYWSDWTGPDDNPPDGFVDFPYAFYGGQDNLPLVSQVPSICNDAPVADAGADQSVHTGDVVTLDGSASTDPDENYPLTYSWQITSMPVGSMTVLWDANTVNPTFVPDVMGDYTIQLVVTDSLGAQSAPDSVLVSTYNTPPVADAGPDRAIIEIGTIVQLDGTQSWDADGDDFTYLWTISTKPAESLAELSDPCSPDPNFVADFQGDYVISLTVTDIFGAVSDADTVAVSFTNVKPVADAGGSQAVIVGETVFLDGSASYDGNGDPLTYSWSFVSVPEGSLAELSDPISVQTSFVADEVGTFIVSLVVNDGFVDSDPANVTIEAISCVDAGIQSLLDLIEAINNLPSVNLKSENMKTPLINKINVVLNQIDRGFYDEAVNKLQNDILQKTNGCAEISEPDKNDWLITCEGQDQIYPLIIRAIEFLENPDGTCF